jgi:ubiquinone/menaquinone biosynthesis C-methylase UbiE
VFADPYLTFDEDHERTEIVLAALDRLQLEPLLEYYWSFSDITPTALRAMFVRSAMLGEQRARRHLGLIGKRTPEISAPSKRVLEIGSGTGNFLAVASESYEQVIGVDIAMRWLHLSRRRFIDKGLPAPALVCCCAEYLPFADSSFDLIVASSTLEFARDQKRVLSECSRTLTEDGLVFINTVNRYSVGRDPYAYLWGVGFLPRVWQAPYVRWRRQASYENIRPLSLSELNRMVTEHFTAREFLLPEVDEASLDRFSAAVRWQARAYRLLRFVPGVRGLLKRFGPGWDAMLSRSVPC